MIHRRDAETAEKTRPKKITAEKNFTFYFDLMIERNAHVELRFSSVILRELCASAVNPEFFGAKG